MVDVSFIVPVYNGEKTIKRAVDSILNQQKSNISYEIIVIDDGSKDRTEKILEEYRTKIKIFKNENHGIAYTRNFGVNKSEGKYIIFVDSDDYISNTLLKDIEKYLKNEIDLIKWSPVWVDDDGNKIKDANHNEFMLTTGEGGFNYLYSTDVLMTALWNYAIKKEIIEKFPKIKYHEDFAVMALTILNARTMVITGKVEYYYVQTNKSIMRGNDDPKQMQRLEDMFYNYDMLLKKSEKLNVDEYTRENFRNYITNSLLVCKNDADGECKKYFNKEIKKRKVYKNLTCRNIKQKIKKILLKIKY